MEDGDVVGMAAGVLVMLKLEVGADCFSEEEKQLVLNRAGEVY